MCYDNTGSVNSTFEDKPKKLAIDSKKKKEKQLEGNKQKIKGQSST